MEDRYLKLIQEFIPQIQIKEHKQILDGWDFVVLDINERYIFRFPKRASTVNQLEREIRLLPVLSKTLPLKIPEFEFICYTKQEWCSMFVGYKKIEGVPISKNYVDNSPTMLAKKIGGFLNALHSFPIKKAKELNVEGGNANVWRNQYRAFYRWIKKKVFPLVGSKTSEKISSTWEEFLLNDQNFLFETVLIHGDLGSEHILIDPEKNAIKGIIDWEDARIGDPALDFVGLMCDLGLPFTERVIQFYKFEIDESFRDRMNFYKRIIPLYEIALGIKTKSEYHLNQGIRALKNF